MGGAGDKACWQTYCWELRRNDTHSNCEVSEEFGEHNLPFGLHPSTNCVHLAWQGGEGRGIAEYTHAHQPVCCSPQC